MINLLFGATLILFTLGQLGRLSWLNQTINVYVYELGAMVLVVVLILKHRLAPWRRYGVRLRYFYWGAAILFLTFVISFPLFSWEQNLVAFLYLGRLCLYGLFFIYAAYEKNLRPDRWLVLAIALIVVCSYLQYWWYPDLRNLFYAGWDPHLHRMFGTFLDTAPAGAIYGVGFYYLLLNLDPPYRKLKLVLLPAFLLAVGLSFSRSLYLACVASGIYLCFWKRKPALIGLGLACFIALVVVLPKPGGEGVNLERTTSILARFKDDKEAINLWLKRPILGWGYNHLRYLRPDNQEKTTLSVNHAAASFHSSYLIVLVTTGVFGLAVFVKLIWQWLTLHRSLLVIGILIVAMSFFDNVILHPFILYFLGVVSLAQLKRRPSRFSGR